MAAPSIDSTTGVENQQSQTESAEAANDEEKKAVESSLPIELNLLNMRVSKQVNASVTSEIANGTDDQTMTTMDGKTLTTTTTTTTTTLTILNKVCASTTGGRLHVPEKKKSASQKEPSKSLSSIQLSMPLTNSLMNGGVVNNQNSPTGSKCNR